MNGFADNLKPVNGWPTLEPVPGQSFDRLNDLFLGHDGVIYPRHTHQGKPIDTNNFGCILEACSLALRRYNGFTE